MVLYLPGSIMAVFIVEHWGMRWAMLVGGFLNFLSCALRFFSSDSDSQPRQNIGNPYGWLLFGQSLAGLGQPIFTNLPARLAGDWFSLKQRDLGTTLAAMANPVGIALGQVLPTLFVTDPSGSGMPRNLLVQLFIAGVVFLLILFFYRSRPKSPPSRTAANRLRTEDQSLRTRIREMRGDVSQLLANPDFRWLLLGFGLGLGLFNALTTLIEQLIQPCGYDSDDAGLFGALIIGCGLLGVEIIGPYMDFSHQYNRILKSLFFCALISTIFFCFVLRPNFYLPLSIGFGCMGFFMLPILPVVFECGVECTHPIDEELSSGMLMLVGNYASVPLVFFLGYLIDLRSDYVNPWSWTNLVLFVAVSMAVICMWIYNGPYHRLQSEKLTEGPSTQSTDRPVHVSQTSYNQAPLRTNSSDSSSSVSMDPHSVSKNT